MELKSYQKEVIADLARYLELVVELQSLAKAYQVLWNEKNVLVGFGGMPNYVNVLPGVPHVCAKVPTGGGKTYIAASSLRTIFDAMPQRRAKAVVWLVPSEAILTQTRKALENPDHPYRQRLDVDFGGRVQVYSKERALMGQNFTPSAVDFHQTLEKVVAGLNSAGFSSRDYRAQDVDVPITATPTQEPEQLPIVPPPADEPDLPEVDGSDLKARFEAATHEAEQSVQDGTMQSDPMLSQALQQNKTYEDEINQADNTALSQAPLEVRDKMNQFRMNEEFADEASALRFPQFMLETGPSLFSEAHETLELEHLEGGFSLRDKDAHVDFTTVNAEMARVDVDDSKDSTAKAWRLSGGDSAFFREWFNTQPSEKRLSLCKGIIKQKLSKMNCVNDRELDEYIDRVIGTMSEDQLSELEQSPYPYVVKIQEKVKELIAQHRSGVFDTWLEQDKISCLPNYALPAVISPTAFTSMVPKSLYTAEEDMNEYEFKVVWALSELGNVKWWHRNISRLGFQINGPVHAYPDIIVMLNSGKVLMVETKDDHLDNDESKEKAKIGDQWAKLAGKQYKYYMVFETKQPDYPGAYSLERFMEIVKGL